jgi:hypothetical protein
MKLQFTLLTSALLLALPVLAKEVPLNQAADIASSVTPASASPSFDALESQALAQLRDALKAMPPRSRVTSSKRRSRTKPRPIKPG